MTSKQMRQEYERTQFLTAWDDIGVGFRKGKPYVSRAWKWATGTAVGSAVIVALALVFFWARYA